MSPVLNTVFIVLVFSTILTTTLSLFCDRNEDCPSDFENRKGVCILKVCDVSKEYHESCHHDKQCERDDESLICKGVCVCDTDRRRKDDKCQVLEPCKTEEECKEEGDECKNGFCHPKKSMLGYALIATCGSVILLAALFAVILVYTTRKINKKHKFFRTLSQQKKTPIFVGSLEPSHVVTVTPEIHAESGEAPEEEQFQEKTNETTRVPDEVDQTSKMLPESSS